MLLYDKYEPGTSEEVSNIHIDEIKSWIKKWKKGRALLLHGPPGSGKSLAVKIAAKEINYKVIDAGKGFYAANRNIFNQGIVIIADVAAKKTIETSQCPFIIMTDDAYAISKETRALCDMIEFKKLMPQDIIPILRNICKKEDFIFEEQALSHIARISNGDVRYAIMALDILNPRITAESAKKLHSKDYYMHIFETLRLIFRSSIENARIAVTDSENTEEEILFWVEENICNEFDDIEEIASAFEYLANGGILGISLSRKKAAKTFVRYMYPKGRRTQKNNSIDDISKSLHMSRKKTVIAMPYLEKIMPSR